MGSIFFSQLFLLSVFISSPRSVSVPLPTPHHSSSEVTQKQGGQPSAGHMREAPSASLCLHLLDASVLCKTRALAPVAPESSRGRENEAQSEARSCVRHLLIQIQYG